MTAIFSNAFKQSDVDAATVEVLGSPATVLADVQEALFPAMVNDSGAASLVAVHSMLRDQVASLDVGASKLVGPFVGIHPLVLLFLPRLLFHFCEELGITGGKGALSESALLQKYGDLILCLYTRLVTVTSKTASTSLAVTALPLPHARSNEGDEPVAVTSAALRQRAVWGSGVSNMPYFQAITGETIKPILFVILSSIAHFSYRIAEVKIAGSSIGSSSVLSLYFSELLHLMGRSGALQSLLVPDALGAVVCVSCINGISRHCNRAVADNDAAIEEQREPLVAACRTWYSSLMECGSPTALLYLHTMMTETQKKAA